MLNFSNQTAIKEYGVKVCHAVFSDFKYIWYKHPFGCLHLNDSVLRISRILKFIQFYCKVGYSSMERNVT